MNEYNSFSGSFNRFDIDNESVSVVDFFWTFFLFFLLDTFLRLSVVVVDAVLLFIFGDNDTALALVVVVDDVSISVNDVDDQKEFEFNSKHSTIIEENAEHGSTDKKREVNEIDDKFMKLFNEVKGKLLHEKEQLNEQRKCRLTKSNSTPLYNTNINDLL